LYAGHGGHGPVSDTVVPVKYHWFVEIEIRENANVYQHPILLLIS
jgi:hypothetical protein